MLREGGGGADAEKKVDCTGDSKSQNDFSVFWGVEGSVRSYKLSINVADAYVLSVEQK